MDIFLDILLKPPQPFIGLFFFNVWVFLRNLYDLAHVLDTQYRIDGGNFITNNSYTMQFYSANRRLARTKLYPSNFITIRFNRSDWHVESRCGSGGGPAPLLTIVFEAPKLSIFGSYLIFPYFV